MKTVAFLTTIFPMKKQFLIDFFDSLCIQTYSNFDVIVVNDGYDNLSDIIVKYQNLSIIELPYSSTPAKNREYGINYCIDKNYDILVFGDSDDYFSKNRIDRSIQLLSNYEIVVNDLTLFNDIGIIEHKYFSNRIENNSIINYSFIKDKNIFGLTNTAINLNILDKVKFKELEVEVDWCMFKKLLKLDFNAIFTNEIISYYRQYSGNTIGLRPSEGEYPFWWEQQSSAELN